MVRTDDLPEIEKRHSVMPAVTVAICCYTMARWDETLAAIESVLSQPVQQVIVVVDHNDELLARLSSGSTLSKSLADDDRLVVISNGYQQGLSGARNTAVTHAVGDIIAFLDDDAVAEPDWIVQLTSAFTDTQLVACGGFAAPVYATPPPKWWPAEFNWVIGCSWVGLPTERAEIRNVIGCNMAISRDAIEAVGGFSDGIGRIGTRSLGCEETDLCIRIRQSQPDSRIIYEPRAVVHHNVPSSRLRLSYFVDRCFAEGLSKALVVERVGQADGLRSERGYAARTLRLAVTRGLRDALAGDTGGALRAAAVCLGLATTILGFVVGRVAQAGKRFRQQRRGQRQPGGAPS